MIADFLIFSVRWRPSTPPGKWSRRYGEITRSTRYRDAFSRWTPSTGNTRVESRIPCLATKLHREDVILRNRLTIGCAVAQRGDSLGCSRGKVTSHDYDVKSRDFTLLLIQDCPGKRDASDTGLLGGRRSKTRGKKHNEFVIRFLRTRRKKLYATRILHVDVCE